jgi:hypothetical protein
MNYYFISVKESLVQQNKPVYIVLSSEVGDADIFVNIQPNSNILKR